jgi:hypothetical protein
MYWPGMGSLGGPITANSGLLLGLLGDEGSWQAPIPTIKERSTTRLMFSTHPVVKQFVANEHT